MSDEKVKPKCAKHGVEMIRTRFFREPGDKVGYLADPHCPECNRESFGKHFEGKVKPKQYCVECEAPVAPGVSYCLRCLVLKGADE